MSRSRNQSTNKSILPPLVTIRRLSGYLRHINLLLESGKKVVSSKELADLLDLNPAQVRKDLAYFGEFGKRGVGYSIIKLKENITNILGLNNVRKVAIVGAGGRLGRALALYDGFEKYNFKIVALFDKEPHVIGETLGNNVIQHIYEFIKTVEEKGIEMVILCVPASAVEEVFEYIKFSSIRGVLNFAPKKLLSTDEIVVQNVDLATELETLSYLMAVREAKKIVEIKDL